ncbi:hypothetical protein E308F_30510 [Moorella sp. E308F]|uniref:hypothetical protein n=1 Tax=Moorella sp. E308F TaxID=2572682 RepID=UPI0010FFC285|nr:hypothetical protein [Moorella sp. E308F]GEA16805.1 hypothetical protein E308F_30510 [Moorella sp. E308F]
MDWTVTGVATAICLAVVAIVLGWFEYDKAKVHKLALERRLDWMLQDNRDDLINTVALLLAQKIWEQAQKEIKNNGY